MKQRTWAVTLATVLLAGSAVAIAASVQGQDFERKGVADAPGTAYEIEWDSEDAGKLRLLLDPADDATSPSAKISLFRSAERIGSYELDDTWPRLDHQAEPGAEYTLIVHRAYQSEVDVLAEEGHPIDIDRVQLTSETVQLAEGEDEAIKTQIAIERDRPYANLALTFDGDAEGLEVIALNADDEPVLKATATRIDTSASEQLVATLHPDAFQASNLLVRVQADELNGTLGLQMDELVEPSDNVVTTETTTRSTSEDNGTSSSTRDEGNATDGTGNGTQASGPELKRIADLPAGTPIAVDVPEGVSALHVVAEEDCGEAVVFGPDDSIEGIAPLSTEDGAERWNSSDDEDEHSRSSSDEVVAEVPVSGPGEHVVVLANSWEDGALYMRVDEAVDHRELDTKEIEGEIDGENRTLLTSSSGTANETLTGGLLGFSWNSNGVDLKREVQLTAPNGDVLYSASGIAADHVTVATDHDGTHPLVGPDGGYTISTESQSALDRGLSYTLVAYER